MELKQFSKVEQQVLTVTQLTEIIRELLEDTIPPVTIEAEISNFRPSSNGHLYFTLKDEIATISAVMFKGKSKNLNFQPKDGMMVRATGKISVYAQRGNYQIIIENMEKAGTGDILLLLEERKQRFLKEGLFDEVNKKKLPFFPSRIGVITSPTGAALRDILQIASRRNPLINIVILPAIVQGSEAATQIANQINVANRYKLADVLIIGRGGGSLEDLLPFSEECVVRAVVASEIPIVSAVGHEIDWALSDFAADMRAPTPSAAAELCTPLLDDILTTIDRNKTILINTLEDKIDHLRLIIRSFSAEALEMRFRTIQQPYLLRFDDAKETLFRNMSDYCKNLKQRITAAKICLESCNPEQVLNRGFSMVRVKATGMIIRDEKEVSSGEVLEIIPQNGLINAKVL